MNSFRSRRATLSVECSYVTEAIPLFPRTREFGGNVRLFYIRGTSIIYMLACACKYVSTFNFDTNFANHRICVRLSHSHAIQHGGSMRSAAKWIGKRKFMCAARKYKTICRPSLRSAAYRAFRTLCARRSAAYEQFSFNFFFLRFGHVRANAQSHQVWTIPCESGVCVCVWNVFQCYHAFSGHSHTHSSRCVPLPSAECEQHTSQAHFGSNFSYMHIKTKILFTTIFHISLWPGLFCPMLLLLLPFVRCVCRVSVSR